MQINRKNIRKTMLTFILTLWLKLYIFAQNFKITTYGIARETETRSH